ncbi:MAG TPA: glycoside hydrolase family 3 N-terminal domain-containing protein [Vicinamibacterales bacterium]|nr:glycoside hydrolase family 3 N-terminal domain-containing protein [Vicinamibacterales bacterium]
MRICVLAAVLALALAPTGAQTSTPVLDSQTFLQQQLGASPAISAADAQRVRDLVAQMTPKEKVGQMTQLEIGMVTDGQDAALQIDPAKLHQAVVEYGVGALLNVKDLALPPAKWHELITAIQGAAGQTRLKIPVVYGIDSIHGANYIEGATLFPQPIGMAATWNPELMLEGSRITAAETRAAGIPWNFSPVLDIGRQPLWPRLYETFGEDPYLASVMGAATVRGYQGTDPSSPVQVGATLKHYVGYSFPWSGHDRTPALIPDVTMHEYFLPSFATGVKTGALAVMVNSGEVNGVPGHVNHHLLIDVLRGELGFDGVIDSDWQDIEKLVSIHHVAATDKDAIRMAVLAGIDMSMVPSDYRFSDLLLQLVQEGAVPMSRVDDAVTRILTMKARLGLFADPLRGTQSGTEVGSAASRATALEAARESIVLLKNEQHVLPLAAASHVLVTGPTADSLVSLDNGWTLTWQGDRAAAYPKDRLTIRGAIEKRLGTANVTYVPGSEYDKPIDAAAAASAARQADAVVLCLGEKSYAETPGNIDDLTLPEPQLELAREVAAAGKTVVLVLVEGRPRVISAVADAMRGIVLGLNPGLEGGTAIADVLFGDVNPSGKLPITYPRYPNALLTYDHKAFEEQDTSFGLSAFRPQFEFGFGLSYTTFGYSGLTVTPATATPDTPIDVAVTVRNTGQRAGAEVVELFVADQVASLTPPVKRLKRFARVTLDPGASQELHFHLTRDDLSFIGPDLKPTVEPGTFTAMVGGMKEDFILKPKA